MANSEIWVALAGGGGLGGIIIAANQLRTAWREGAEKREDRAAQKIKETQASTLRRAELAEFLYEHSEKAKRWWMNRATRLERVIILGLGAEHVPEPTTPEPETPEFEPEKASG